MPNFLRLLLLAATILSLQTARWAYVRGQAQPMRKVAAQRPTPASGTDPQWLPYASWYSGPVPTADYDQPELASGPAAISTL